MKLNKIFSALMLALAVSFAACHNTPEPPTPGPGPGPQTEDSTEVDEPIDWSLLGELPEGCMTVAQALELGATLSETDTTDYVYIRGVVKKLKTDCADAIANYGNANFYLADSKGAKEDFQAFQVYFLDHKKFQDAQQLVVGDLVVVKVRIINYKGTTIESVGKGDGYIYKTTNTFKPAGSEVGDIDYLEGEMTCTEAVAATASLEKGKTTDDSLVVRGQVTKVEGIALIYGNATFYISDGTNEFYIYQSMGLNKAKLCNDQVLKVGDIVTCKGKVTNYNGTIEMKAGYITRTTNTAEYSETAVEDVTVEQALEIGAALPKGASDNSKLYKVSGVVLNVTEASTDYGNLTFDMGTDAAKFTAYRVYYKENKKYTAADPVLEKGDEVVVYCQIQHRNDGSVQTNGGYVFEHTK